MHMKKFILTILSIVVVGSFAQNANAQMMGGFSNTSVDWDEVVEHTAREEQEGKELWNKLQAKEVVCADLNDEQHGELGEYFMGQMMGNSHAAMNAMMIQAHGEEGEEQIHIVMGQRLSGCNVSATFSREGIGWMPMMQMMWGGWPGNGGVTGTGMMGDWGYGMSGLGFITTLLIWVVLILAIVGLWRWIKSNSPKTP